MANAYLLAGRGTAVAVVEVIDVGEDAVVHLRPMRGPVSANAHLLSTPAR
ncbi:MAG: hypothetical protein ABR511_11195 [Acidimicrobiales bacterium]